MSHEVSCNCNLGRDVTGYVATGGSRLFLPADKGWTSKFVKQIGEFASAEIRAFSARLNCEAIKEINLLELKSVTPKRQAFITGAEYASPQYTIQSIGFRVHNKALYLKFSVDAAFHTHTNVYLFPSAIAREYDSIKIATFSIPITHTHHQLRFLTSINRRNWSHQFTLSDVILREEGKYFSFFTSGSRGIWVDIQNLKLMGGIAPGVAKGDLSKADRMVTQISKLEKSILQENGPIERTSVMDSGGEYGKPTVVISSSRVEENMESGETTAGIGQMTPIAKRTLPSMSSTRRDEDVEMEAPNFEDKLMMLESINENNEPLGIPEDRNMAEIIDSVKLLVELVKDKEVGELSYDEIFKLFKGLEELRKMLGSFSKELPGFDDFILKHSPADFTQFTAEGFSNLMTDKTQSGEFSRGEKEKFETAVMKMPDEMFNKLKFILSQEVEDSGNRLKKARAERWDSSMWDQHVRKRVMEETPVAAGEFDEAHRVMEEYEGD